MIKKIVSQGCCSAVVRECGSRTTHLSGGKESRWPSICLKYFADSFLGFGSEERVKGRLMGCVVTVKGEQVKMQK